MEDKDEKVLIQTKETYKIIKDGLEIDLSEKSIKSILDVSETEQDTKDLMNRMLLLSRLSQYCSVIQGHAIYLQKKYKTPESYGLTESISELNRSIRNEVEVLRSILSHIKEQIRIR